MDLLESDDVAAAVGSPLREANRPDELSMAASPTPGGSASRSRAKQLERQLTLLEEAHQLELERKVELERTIENLRSQLRSLSAMRSTEKRQVEVLRQQLDRSDKMRGLADELRTRQARH